MVGLSGEGVEVLQLLTARQLKMKFTSTPAWTMLPRRQGHGEHGSPGPGTYSPSPSKSSPAYSLGTSARPAWVQSGPSPGPGAYDPLEGKGTTGHA